MVCVSSLKTLESSEMLLPCSFNFDRTSDDDCDTILLAHTCYCNVQRFDGKSIERKQCGGGIGMRRVKSVGVNR
jgi:hypothetical protein